MGPELNIYPLQFNLKRCSSSIEGLVESHKTQQYLELKWFSVLSSPLNIILMWV